MRNLEQFGNRCILELNAIGIYPNEITNWEINTRAKKRFGQCRKVNGIYSININSTLLDERVPENSLRNTIYHELLHAVDGCMNHGDKWKRLAELVSDCYSMDITRCSTFETKYGTEVAKEILAERKSKLREFSCECQKCGKVITQKRERTPKWYSHPENYKCGICGGKLKTL